MDTEKHIKRFEHALNSVNEQIDLLTIQRGALYSELDRLYDTLTDTKRKKLENESR